MSVKPQFSFVIPVLNEAAHLCELLDNLRRDFPAAEVVVVDGGSSDDSVAQAIPRCDQLLLCRPGRAAQMNLGAQGALGQYVFFLHADTVLAIDEQQLRTTLADSPAWGFSRVRLSGTGLAFRVIEWFINQRSTRTGIGTGDQMLFVRADVFDSFGGFEDIPLMEDVALCKRLRTTSAPHILDQPVVTSSRRWEEGGVANTVVRMWCLRFAFFVGVSPRRLWQHYYRS